MDIEQARTNMLTQQIRVNNITNENILNILAEVPREFFVPNDYKNLAFADMNIPIGYKQVMMRPLEESLLINAIALQQNDRTLEIGTGTGFVTALLAKQAHHVDTIDIFSDFSEHAKNKLEQLELSNVTFITGDASKGWPNQKLYDAIVLTGSTPVLPKSFLEQLTIKGRLFAIIGVKPIMTATLFSREQTQHWITKHLFETAIPSLLHAPTPNPFKF